MIFHLILLVSVHSPRLFILVLHYHGHNHYQLAAQRGSHPHREYLHHSNYIHVFHRCLQRPGDGNCRVRLVQTLPRAVFLEHAGSIMGHTGPYDPSYDTISISVIQPSHVNSIHFGVVCHGDWTGRGTLFPPECARD